MNGQLPLFDAPAQPVKPELPDEPARRRIRSDLETSLLVEAGAGAGKTTEMVGRMVALVRSGRAEVQQVAAVTFTRKAAAELRERFQTALETELRGASGATAERLDLALRDIDRAFLGTIHAFCARLLRERPLEAGLDPAFRETMGGEETQLRRAFWHQWLERLAAAGDDELGVLREAGLAPHDLVRLYDELVDQPDVEYPADPHQRPDPSWARARVEQLMDRAATLQRDRRRDDDPLRSALRRLDFQRNLGWGAEAAFMDVLAQFTASSFKCTRNRWRDADDAVSLGEELESLWAEGGAVHAMLREWRAHRYPIALHFAQRAAAAYEQERLRSGTLNFHDLLTFAARLLRTSLPARRELGERYRFLLVDEFQDTDPLQAEVLFLLASDEEPELFGDRDVAAWLHLTPRPGALFVVGDPKQSIYRFRRADMTLYRQVRQRFEEWERMQPPVAAAVELTTNFRSHRSIERFVNDNFRERFGAESTELQARFAETRVHPRKPARREGVFRYEHPDPTRNAEQIEQQDADMVAAWICDRVRRGERDWGDFLILTYRKRIEKYVKALEQRDAPVRVSGAGAQADAPELGELQLLLRALCDPGDATLVVAVLTGLLFGIDYEQLVQHREKWAEAGRAPFGIAASWDDAESAVEKALGTLNRFWWLSRREPSDVVVGTIVRELGLLAFAASGRLGSSRAGALLFALDAVRATAVAGDASLTGALHTLDAALKDAEVEAPLEPGERNAVRIMNLHKAKGLEAPVVVLAMPIRGTEWPPERRIVRDARGRARGYLEVSAGSGPDKRVLARPLDWEEHARIELEFQRAEDNRLLYVAATRAAEELVIGCADRRSSPSPWRSFHSWLTLHAERIEITVPPVPPRAQVDMDAAAMSSAIARVNEARRHPAAPTYRAAAVTERKAEVRVELEGVEQDALEVQQLGTDWGSAVHDALQALAANLDDDAMRLLCRNALIAHERPVSADGVPLELDNILAIVHAVRRSPLWLRAEAAELRLVEVPFAVTMSAAEYALLTGAAAGPPLELMDGRIDLAFREHDGWVIVDYKTDAAGARIPTELMQKYHGQLKLYRAAWERITSERVKEVSLLFTADVAAAARA